MYRPAPAGSHSGTPVAFTAMAPRRAPSARTHPFRRPALVLAAWTLFVWGQRVVNIVGDDELSGAGRSARLALAGLLLGLGVLAGVQVLRPGASRRAVAGSVRALAAVTVVVWAWRAVDIALGDWSVGFVVVHLVLAGVSIGLSVWAWRATSTTRAARSPIEAAAR